MVSLSSGWHFSGEMWERNPYLFIFLNTFKYVSAHETITLINASILKKEEYEYSTFSKQKVSITKYSIVSTATIPSHACDLSDDLAMLYGQNRSQYRRVRGEEARLDTADVARTVLVKRLKG